MAPKLFGTDGVRGVAGELLTAELALALGASATRRTGESPGSDIGVDKRFIAILPRQSPPGRLP